ncbi:MAG: glycosyltransferase, partial [Chloroflexota bacterium]
KTRTLTETPDGYAVNGEPLSFFHFSGFSPDNQQSVSKHQNRFDMSMLNDAFRRCFADYGRRMKENGLKETRKIPYYYGSFDNGVPVSSIAHAMLREHDPNGDHFPNPYATEGGSTFFAWLTEPLPGLPAPVSRYALAVHSGRIDLQATFPNPMGEHAGAFARWFAESTDNPKLLHAGYRNPVRQHLGMGLLPMPQPRAGLGSIAYANPTPGVNLIGYAYSETGVGQLLRNNLVALEEQGFPVAVLPLTEHDKSRKHDRTADRFLQGAPHRVNLFHVNADMTENVRRSLDPQIYADHYNIAIWAWEMPTFPEKWHAHFDVYDEIWVISDFIRDTLRKYTHKPVSTYPITIDFEPDPTITREQLGLPSDAFIALYSFDALSIFARKNPLAVVEAFERAFTEAERRDQVRLVIKANNLSKFPAEAQQLQAALERVNGMLMSAYLTRPQVHALYNHANTYISMHRSEGFGLSMAESMLMGKPVVGTAYSGNVDFMKPDNSYLVPYNLVELERDYPPYTAGNTWADPDIDAAAAHLREIYDNPQSAADVGARAADYIRQHNSKQAVGEYLTARLNALLEKA